VTSVNSGSDGISVLRERKIDLIVLDLMMPDMDGWDVCRQVRSFSNVPIIVLSALNDPSMIASILDTGADDYLVKPTASSVLIAHIKQLVRRTATGSLQAAAGSPQGRAVSSTHPLMSK
jgi:DNA-binding response OmpR family regulator